MNWLRRLIMRWLKLNDYYIPPEYPSYDIVTTSRKNHQIHLPDFGYVKQDKLDSGWLVDPPVLQYRLGKIFSYQRYRYGRFQKEAAALRSRDKVP